MPTRSSHAPAYTTPSSERDGANLEPDEEWKRRLKEDLEQAFVSMIQEARDNHQEQLMEGVISEEQLDVEYQEALQNIKALAHEQYQLALMKERNKRRWIAGVQMLPGWNDILHEEQQNIMRQISSIDNSARVGENTTNGRGTNGSPPSPSTGLYSMPTLSYAPAHTPTSSECEGADLEPDEEWKRKLKEDIDQSFKSMIQEARDHQQVQLKEGNVSQERLDVNYKQTLHSIKALAEEQYLCALMKERNERRWIAGVQMLPGWNDILHEEQQKIMNSINHSDNPARVAKSPTDERGTNGSLPSSSATSAPRHGSKSQSSGPPPIREVPTRDKVWSRALSSLSTTASRDDPLLPPATKYQIGKRGSTASIHKANTEESLGWKEELTRKEAEFNLLQAQFRKRAEEIKRTRAKERKHQDRGLIIGSERWDRPQMKKKEEQLKEDELNSTSEEESEYDRYNGDGEEDDDGRVDIKACEESQRLGRERREANAKIREQALELRRLKDEERRMEEEGRKLDEKERQKEEIRRKEEEIWQKEEAELLEARRAMERLANEARAKEEEMNRKEKEVKKREEDAKKQAEDARKLMSEAAKRAEETKKKETEVRLQVAELEKRQEQLKEEELRNQALKQEAEQIARETRANETIKLEDSPAWQNRHADGAHHLPPPPSSINANANDNDNDTWASLARSPTTSSVLALSFSGAGGEVFTPLQPAPTAPSQRPNSVPPVAEDHQRRTERRALVKVYHPQQGHPKNLNRPVVYVDDRCSPVAAHPAHPHLTASTGVRHRVLLSEDQDDEYFSANSGRSNSTSEEESEHDCHDGDSEEDDDEEVDVKARELEAELQRRERERREADAKIREQALELRRVKEEERRVEEEGRKLDEEERRKEEIRWKEETAKLLESAARLADEARKKEEGTKIKEKQLKKRKEDAKREGDDARKLKLEAAKKAEETKKKEAEVKIKEAELEKRKEQLKEQEDELRNQELKRQAEQIACETKRAKETIKKLEHSGAPHTFVRSGYSGFSESERMRPQAGSHDDQQGKIRRQQERVEAGIQLLKLPSREEEMPIWQNWRAEVKHQRLPRSNNGDASQEKSRVSLHHPQVSPTKAPYAPPANMPRILQVPTVPESPLSRCVTCVLPTLWILLNV